MYRYGAIIEARMGSSRLPGKVLLPINNIPVIILLVDRLKQVKDIKKIIVATTISKKDDILCKVLKKNNINFYRGSEENVLQRVTKAAKEYKIKNIVQITGDCPLIDPELVSQVISVFHNNRIDFVSNSTIRTYPDGMDVCIFSTRNLEKSLKLTSNKYDLEHVTLFLKRKKKLFNRINLMAPQYLHLPNLGLTLDEIEDYKLIKNIFQKFWKTRKTFSCLDIVRYLEDKPKIIFLNKKIKRKKIPLKI
jgi:spore coat polysaccharide biosynthesis protein SpsF